MVGPAQYRDSWQALTIAVINKPSVSTKCGEYLD
jgi:hypothetical protein